MHGLLGDLLWLLGAFVPGVLAGWRIRSWTRGLVLALALLGIAMTAVVVVLTRTGNLGEGEEQLIGFFLAVGAALLLWLVYVAGWISARLIRTARER